MGGAAVGTDDVSAVLCLGAWYVTLGVVMGKFGLAAIIGDAYSTGPIASILSPFVLGMLVDRFFASQKVLGVLHLIGAGLLWLMPGFFSSGQSGLLWIIFGYMLCYMPTIALSNNVAFYSLSNSEKAFLWCGRSAPLAGLSPG